MPRWIVVPVKAPAACKQRLRPALDDAARAALVGRMLGQVLTVAGAAAGPDDRIAILGPERHGLPASIPLIADDGGDLNAALALARRAAIAAGATRLVSISADLPHLVAADVTALLAVAGEAIGIAPDQAGGGTNALSLPLPAASGFTFAFGAASHASHAAEARRLGRPLLTIRRPGLARDVDLPEDLANLPPVATG